jgi:glycosyltransferase involved in cell wall biosynthesis
MIKNRNIIVFGEDWGRFPSTTQHIVKVFLKYNRIMWIGSLGHRKPEFTLADIKRVIEKVLNILRPKPLSEKSDVITIHPIIIPLHDIKFIRSINEFLLKRKLRKAIREHNFNNPIIITSTPIIGKILGSFGETSSSYFCLDDYSMFEGAFKSMLKLENQLLKKVTCSFAVSDLLKDTRIPATKKSFFLPQGVDVDHFIKKIDTIPEELRKLKKPVIGFFGLVSSWIDIDLIVYCAKQLPNYTFLIIGKPSVDVSKFDTSPNINFIGEVPFAKLPLYASVFDVGMISFVVNELTIACNPLKLLEYLSLSIPVVSTNLPEVQKFKDDVLVANNYDEFVNGIKKSVMEAEQSDAIKRRMIAEKFSWSSIAENISTEILKAEAETRNG